MLLPLHHLIDTYALDIRGIVHVGASLGQEINQYNDAGIEDVIWIEADPEIYSALCERLKPYPHSRCFQACISNQDGLPVQFKVTSNQGQSSSILNLKEHAIFYPNIVVVREVQLQTVTLDTLLQQEGIEVSGKYNFLNMDIQGAELLAMQGMTKNLHKFRYVYLEVNKRELYEGCALEEEVDNYLKESHFKPVESKWRPAGWGDKFYIREW
jgi:FkbM family methyltransferase